MHFLSTSLLLAAAARFALAEPIPLPTEGDTTHTLTARSDGWAYFCDDENCETNCEKKGYSIRDTGCFQVPDGRHSIHVDKNMHLDDPFSLIHSPTAQCPCRASCDVYGGMGDHTSCFKVTPGNSLRWIGGGCPTGGGAC